MRALVLPGGGIGDSLMMMIASRHLRDAGYSVTVIGSAVCLIAPLFFGYGFSRALPQTSLSIALRPFDKIIAQLDQSEQTKNLAALKGQFPITFFAPSSHRSLRSTDFCFDRRYPMAINIAAASLLILNKGARCWLRQGKLRLSKNLAAQLRMHTSNGALPSPTAVYRRFPTRVALHPKSGSEKTKNWSQSSFIQLAYLLKRGGFTPVFVMSPKERLVWRKTTNAAFPVPHFPLLSQTATYLYESGFFIGNDSGLGHLASNLSIPTVTVNGSWRAMRLWRPGWSKGAVVTPWPPLHNFKKIRWHARDRYWSYFISSYRVYGRFWLLTKQKGG